MTCLKYRLFSAFSATFALALLCSITSSQAQNVGDQNSTISVNPVNQSGMDLWSVDGHNYLNQQWFWISLGPLGGGTPPVSIDTLALTQDTVTGNNLFTAYAGPGYTISISYTLNGSSPGSGTSTLGENIQIVNTSSNSLPLSFFQYSDFDMGPGSNTVVISKNLAGLYYDAYQTSIGGALASETDITPGANETEAGLEFATKAKLNNGVSPVILNDNTTDTGNVTWAFEWDRTLASGGALTISKTLALQVPEPTTVALISLGLTMCVLRRRRC
jgi:hypothetical protein